MHTMNNLPDIQNQADTRHLPLPRVGVNNVQIPLQFKHLGQAHNVIATCCLGSSLDAEHKGTNMSRLLVELTTWAKKPCELANWFDLLDNLQIALEDKKQVFAEIKFKYFLKKTAPVTKLVGLQAYLLTIAACRNGSTSNLQITIELLTSNCCPCSKAIAKAGAHNQRVTMIATVDINHKNLADFSLPDLIEKLENCGSCPLFPVLKRPDEKWITERQYQNPKFVEDVTRDAMQLLQNYNNIEKYQLSVTAHESIHSHNAFAEVRN